MEKAYKKLRASWEAGDRDRERALHLFFLSWMHWADPPFVTGLSDNPIASELWYAIFDHFQGEASRDAEFLYVASIMAQITPWGLGDEQAWEAAAERMTERSLQLKPDGFSPGMFEGRSDYGNYFAHQSRNRKA